MRGIASADNLVAHVEGHIEDAQGVLRITRIHLTYRLRVPAGSREKAERVLDVYAEKCPAYQSVKGCIHCSWQVEIEEQEQ